MEKKELVGLLRKMGLGEKITEHKAFDLVLDRLAYKIKKSCDLGLNYSKYVPNSGMIEISGSNNKKNLKTGLKVTSNSIDFYSSANSNAVIPTDGGANFWSCGIDQYDRLVVKDTFGTSLLKFVNEKGKQFDFSNATTRVYDDNGINVSMELLDSSNKVNTGTFQPRAPRYYLGVKGTEHKWVIRRDGLDYGCAMQYLNGNEQRAGVCIFSGEWGLQEIRLMNNGDASDYIFDAERIPERTDEYYELALSHDNEKISEVLLRDWGKKSNQLKSRSR